MRRSFLITSLIFIVISSLFPIEIYSTDHFASESDTWHVDMEGKYTMYLSEPYAYEVDIHKIYNKIEDEVYFCISPYRSFGAQHTYTDTKGDHSLFDRKRTLEMSKIVAAYNILEPEPTYETTAVYAAATYLLWEALPCSDFSYADYVFDLDHESSDYELFKDEVETIRTMVEDMDVKDIVPEFDLAQNGGYKVGDTVTLIDKNKVLDEDIYEIEVSNGIEDIRIEGDKLTFQITNDEPSIKNIDLILKQPITLEEIHFGEVYRPDSHVQFLYRFDDIAPKIYSEISLNIEVIKDEGKLKIIKVDDLDNKIDAEIKFALYHAKESDGGYIIDKEVEGVSPITVKGETELSLEAGYYFIQEIEGDSRYIIDDEPELIEIKKDTNFTYKKINPRRSFKVNIQKYDMESDYYINDTEFTISKIEDTGSKVYFIAVNERHDLNDHLEVDDDQELLFIDAQGMTSDGESFLFDKVQHLDSYIVKKLDHDSLPFMLEGMSTYVQKESYELYPLSDVRVIKDQEDLTDSLEVLSMKNDIYYSIIIEDTQYIIRRKHLIYDIGNPMIEARENDYCIYEVIERPDIYVTTGDDTILDESKGTIQATYIAKAYTENDGTLSFDGLFANERYLICESMPAKGYEYGSQTPCLIFDPYDMEEADYYNINYQNKQIKADIAIHKTNSEQNILLNGAGFEIYKQKDPATHQVLIDKDSKTDDIFLGYYVSGALNINEGDIENVDSEKMIEIFKDGQSIRALKPDFPINITGLNDGTYEIKVYDPISNSYLFSVKKEVKKGHIYIEDLAYDEKIILNEKVAPTGYRIDGSSFSIDNKEKVEGHIDYYRINELLIIPPDEPSIKRRYTYIVPTAVENAY